MFYVPASAQKQVMADRLAQGATYESTYPIDVNGNINTVLSVLDPSVNRSSFAVAVLETGDKLSSS